MKKQLLCMSLLLAACGSKHDDDKTPATPAPAASIEGTWVQSLSSITAQTGDLDCTQNVLTITADQLHFGELSYDLKEGTCQGLTQSFEAPYDRLKYTIQDKQAGENAYTLLTLKCMWEFYQCPSDTQTFAVKVEGEQLALVTVKTGTTQLDFANPRSFIKLPPRR